jgi:deoxyribodipyrimidine photo-lyase
VQFRSAEAGASVDDGAYLRQLIWWEFSYHLLYHFPDLPDSPLRPEFNQFPWRDDPEVLSAWQRGRPDPIVDAGMRELWATGCMIVASFLVKDLLLPWQAGEAWFWDTLVDADLANNAASWQWMAGCGADAAPYFRIFNPVSQGRQADPEGNCLWVPELTASGLADNRVAAPNELIDLAIAARRLSTLANRMVKARL